MITIDTIIGKDVIIHHPELVNLFGCEIGDGSSIAAYVEIGRGVKLGKNCRIQASVYIPTGVELEDEVFVGPGTVFTNDKLRSTKPESIWRPEPTLVKRGARIGANCTILSGITIGENALIGAGSVVTRSIDSHSLAYGIPARIKEMARRERSTKQRSLAKTATWRVLALVITFTGLQLLTGDWGMSIGVAVGLNAIKTVVFYYHERVWSHIEWGIK